MAMKKRSRRGGDDDVTVNFSGVESGEFRPIPDGNYTAEIISAEVQNSKASNSPMIALKWRISEGKFKGRQLFDNVSLLPQALWKLKTLLEVLSIEPEEEDSSAKAIASELVEKEGTIIVTNQKYEGEDRAKVTGYGEAEETEDEEEADEDEDEEEKPKKKKGKADEEEEDEDEDEDEDEEDEEETEEEEPKVRNKGSKVKEGSRVSFQDGKKTIRGTVTSLDKGEAIVEDKNGDEYQIDASDLTIL